MLKQLNINNEMEKTQGLGLQNTEKTTGDLIWWSYILFQECRQNKDILTVFAINKTSSAELKISFRKNDKRNLSYKKEWWEKELVIFR